MCLDLKSDKTKSFINKSDIICYKVLIERPYINYHGTCSFDYKTLYQKTDVFIGVTYASEIKRSYNYVDKGLHSFGKLNQTIKFINDNYKNRPVVIVRCIIPKGSTVYHGMFGDCDSYASNVLSYLKIVYKTCWNYSTF